MDTSKNQDYSQHTLTSRAEDQEWVVVRGGDDTNDNKEEFEIIDASEIRCWCGGKDVESCRIKGHTFPFCEIERGKFRPDATPRYVQSGQHEGMWIISGPVTDEGSASGEAGDTSSKSKARSGTVNIPFSDGVDPISKVMILSSLLEALDKKRRSRRDVGLD